MAGWSCSIRKLSGTALGCITQTPLGGCSLVVECECRVTTIIVLHAWYVLAALYGFLSTLLCYCSQPASCRPPACVLWPFLQPQAPVCCLHSYLSSAPKHMQGCGWPLLVQAAPMLHMLLVCDTTITLSLGHQCSLVGPHASDAAVWLIRTQHKGCAGVVSLGCFAVGIA